MKKFALVAFGIILTTLTAFLAAGCQKITGGGEVLDSAFVLNEEAEPPATGTPADYTPEENLAFASYKFNHASSWETFYHANVTAVGTNQKVENVRQFDGDAIFMQAISASSVKSVAEQKYIKGNTILFRPSKKINKSEMTATWGAVTQMSEEDFYRDYGLINDEIFKFIINKDTIISSKSSKVDGNFAFTFVLSPDCAKYMKNEVRTLSGAKSDPTYLEAECTIVMDSAWNVISTSAREKYKVAIMGGITCESNSTEEFYVRDVFISEKPLFESYAPSEGETVEKPKGSLDYLTLAFTNLGSEDGIDLEANIGNIPILVNVYSKTGLFNAKIGNTIVSNKGKFMYISGKSSSVKIKPMSLFNAIASIVKELPEIELDGFTLPLDTPEINALIDEVTAMFGGGEDESAPSTEPEQPAEPQESIINRIVDGISDPLDETENSAAVEINFTLDGIGIFARIEVKDEKLAALTARLSYGDKQLSIGLKPTNKKVEEIDENAAVDISKLVEAIGNVAKGDSISLMSDDILLTVGFDGSVYFSYPELAVKYFDKTVKLIYAQNNISADLGLLDIAMPQLGIGDILNMIASLKNLKLSALTEAKKDELTFSLSVLDKPMSVTLGVSKSGELDISVTALGKTFVSTSQRAQFDESGEFVRADGLIRLVNSLVGKGGIGLKLNATVQDSDPIPPIDLSVSLADRSIVAKIGGTTMQVTDAIYILNSKMRGSLSFDAIASALPNSDGEKLDMTYLLGLLSSGKNLIPAGTADAIKGILADTKISNDGEKLLIEYEGAAGSVPLKLSFSIDSEITFSGEIEYAGKAITFDGQSGELLKAESTTGCISFDPVLYTALDMANDMPMFELDLTAGKNSLSALMMPDLTNKGLILSVSDTDIYAYDKIYLANKSGGFSMSYGAALTALKELGIDLTDIWKVIEFIKKISVNFDYSIGKTDNLLELTVDALGVRMVMRFDYLTNYFAGAELSSKDLSATIEINGDAPHLTKPDVLTDSPIDFAVELIPIIKNMLTQKQFSISLDNLTMSSGSQISGFVSLDLAESLGVAADISLTSGGKTHRIMAKLADNSVNAYYIYNSQAMQLSLTKEHLLNILFKVTDILHIDMLEKYRPTSSTKVDSPIIYNALPQGLKDTLTGLSDVVEKGLSIADLDFNNILGIVDTVSVSGESGRLALSIGGASPISLELTYGQSLDGVSINSDSVSGNLSIATAFQDIEPPQMQGSFDMGTLDNLLSDIINTVNFGEYNVEGTINLSLFFDKLSLVEIPFTLKAKIVDNSDPFVYLHLHTDSFLFNTLCESDGYIFFHNGIMYLKSERKSGSDKGKTLYRKRTPQEFISNIVDDLLFLVPLGGSIAEDIKTGISNSTNSNPSYAEALSSFDYSGNIYTLKLNLEKLSGKGSLGEMKLKLTSVSNAIKSFEIDMNIAKVLPILITAELKEFNDTISYGTTGSDNMSSSITDMEQKLNEIKAHAPEWN